MWSDGAASQLKGRRPFYFVGRYPPETDLEMRWNFFGFGHGKGEHDGAGAVIKRALTHEQLKGRCCAYELCRTCCRFLKN